MLVLCERNAGRVQEARQLARSLEGEARSWADWLFELEDLAEGNAEVTP